MKMKNVWSIFAAVLFLTVAGCKGGEVISEEVTETPQATETPEETVQPVVKYTLTIDLQGSAGGVKSEPAGADCEGDCSAEFDEGTTVVLSSKPVLYNSKLKEWSGNCSVPDGYSGTASPPPCQIVMDADKTVTAKYELTPPYAPGLEIDRGRDIRDQITPQRNIPITPPPPVPPEH